MSSVDVRTTTGFVLWACSRSSMELQWMCVQTFFFWGGGGDFIDHNRKSLLESYLKRFSFFIMSHSARQPDGITGALTVYMNSGHPSQVGFESCFDFPN